MRQFLLQMTGEPGSGKSALAAAVGKATGAVVLDKDIVKSRILDGEADMGLDGLPEAVAGSLHHAIVFDLARSLLIQGFSVVIDGAAFYPIVRSKGRAMADAVGANYYLIECLLPNVGILQERIDSKVLMSSQPRVASLGGYSRPGTAPLTEPHLQVDTRQSVDVCLAEALEYLQRVAS